MVISMITIVRYVMLMSWLDQNIVVSAIDVHLVSIIIVDILTTVSENKTMITFSNL